MKPETIESVFQEKFSLAFEQYWDRERLLQIIESDADNKDKLLKVSTFIIEIALNIQKTATVEALQVLLKT